MGRPRKFSNTEAQTLEEIIADYIQENACGMPGCMAEFHLEEAEHIISLVNHHNEQYREMEHLTGARKVS